MNLKVFALAIFILLVFFSIGLQGKDDPPLFEVGDIAPPFSLEAILQAPVKAANINENLKGKIVVLEFWATWCGPCREAIPHVNGLVDEFKDKPVRFIYISDEEEWKVKNFLKIYPIMGWIGLDTDSSMFKTYGFKTIPQTVVIDRNGRIAAITLPRLLDSELIRKLLKGESLTLEEASSDSVRTKEKNQDKTDAEAKAEQQLLEVSIRPAKPSNSMRISGNSFIARGMSLHKLVSTAYGISPARLAAAAPHADNSYEVKLILPKSDRKQLLALLRQSLEAAFGLKVRRETREKEVLVLKASDETAKFLKPSKHDSEMPIMSDEGQVTSEGTSMQVFCAVLEKATGKIVMNDTDLKGIYDIALYWKPEDPHSIITSIKDQLGLEMKAEIRSIEVMVYEIELPPSEKS